MYMYTHYCDLKSCVNCVVLFSPRNWHCIVLVMMVMLTQHRNYLLQEQIQIGTILSLM